MKENRQGCLSCFNRRVSQALKKVVKPCESGANGLFDPLKQAAEQWNMGADRSVRRNAVNHVRRGTEQH